MSNPKKSGCRGKTTVFTYEHAIERRNDFKKRYGETLTIYKCKACHFLHLGHKLNDKTTEKRRKEN